MLPPSGKITKNRRKITFISEMYRMYLAYLSARGYAGTCATEIAKSGPGVGPAVQTTNIHPHQYNPQENDAFVRRG
jgi:hypothetical protein